MMNSELVFSDPRSGRMGGSFRSRVWSSLFTKAGLRHVRIDNLWRNYLVEEFRDAVCRRT
jgi:hypothetical protein